MKNLSINWKTTVAGFAILALVVGHILYPTVITSAVTLDVTTLLAGAGFVAAKDGTVTGIGATATTIEQDALPLVNDLTAQSNNATIKKIHDIAQALLVAQSLPGASPAPPVIVNVHTMPAPAPDSAPTATTDDLNAVPAT